MRPGRCTCSQNVRAKADGGVSLCTQCSLRRLRRGEEEGGVPGRHFSHPRRVRRNTLAWLQLVERVRGKGKNDECALWSRQEVVVNLRMS